MYAILELGGRAVARLSTHPDHVPALPARIAEQIQELLQPGDVIVTRKEHAISNYLLPGYWPHVAMYVGGQQVVEAMKDGVRVREMASPFGNDSVAVIRPVLDADRIQQAIVRARSHVGNLMSLISTLREQIGLSAPRLCIEATRVWVRCSFHWSVELDARRCQLKIYWGSHRKDKSFRRLRSTAANSAKNYCRVMRCEKHCAKQWG